MISWQARKSARQLAGTPIDQLANFASTWTNQLAYQPTDSRWQSWARTIGRRKIHANLSDTKRLLDMVCYCDRLLYLKASLSQSERIDWRTAKPFEVVDGNMPPLFATRSNDRLSSWLILGSDHKTQQSGLFLGPKMSILPCSSYSGGT